MRLAVTGTHGSGKTTLVEDFAAAHPDYTHVVEPYETLLEAGVVFSDPPTIADYLEQLEHSIETLHAQEATQANVVFDRSPIDFLAYLSVLGRRTRGDGFAADTVLEDIGDAIGILDLIVFLPLVAADTMPAEYPALQRAVDRELQSILLDDGLSLLSSSRPRLITLRGTRPDRLQALERAVSRHPSGGPAGA